MEDHNASSLSSVFLLLAASRLGASQLVIDGSLDLCNVPYKELVGNGWCNYDLPGYNTAECNWDGGDCCESTCEKYYSCDIENNTLCEECGSHQYVCFDPVEQRQDENSYFYPVRNWEHYEPVAESAFVFYSSKAEVAASEEFPSFDGNETYAGPLCRDNRTSCDIPAQDGIQIHAYLPRRVEVIGKETEEPSDEEVFTTCATQWNINFENADHETDPVTLVKIMFRSTADFMIGENLHFVMEVTDYAGRRSSIVEWAESPYFYDPDGELDTDNFFPTMGMMVPTGWRILSVETRPWTRDDQWGDIILANATDPAQAPLCIESVTAYRGDPVAASRLPSPQDSSPAPARATSLTTVASLAAAAVVYASATLV